MAMIKCPICEEEISDKAKKCPHGGSVFKRNKVKAIIIAIVSVILMLSLIYGAVTGIKNYQKQKTIVFNVMNVPKRMFLAYFYGLNRKKKQNL